MEPFFDQAGRALAGAYAVYLGLVGALGFFGFHALFLAILLLRRLPRFRQLLARCPERFRHALRLASEVSYGFLNPLIYLVIFQPYNVFRPGHRIDPWMAAFAWGLFAALWGTRVFLPRDVEMSPSARKRLWRLSVLGISCLAAFAINDLIRAWIPTVLETPGSARTNLSDLWVLVVCAPLYLIPMLLLHDYQSRLAHVNPPTGFLLLPRRLAVPLSSGVLALVLLMVAVSSYHPSDTKTRARVRQFAPVITETAQRYSVDPKVVAAIVYVTQREQIEPFRDHLERLTTATFLMDATSHLMLAKPFDVSIGVAQIKPITALTALRLCAVAGQPWGLNSKHFRDLPLLGPEWPRRVQAGEECEPPILPVPVNKPDVVSALFRDEGNIAFASLILALYQRQWRDANPAWDISTRPEILSTLYQIGFAKSHPHAAPRSNAFGERVGQVYREPWLQEYFPNHPPARRAQALPRCERTHTAC